MKKKTKKKTLSLKMSACLCVVLMLISSFLIYYFSLDSRVKVSAATGNYYYTDQQVLDIAKVNSASRYWLTPKFLIENRLKADPLIESVSVKKKNDSILIDIQEKTVIGYYVKDGKNYMLTNKGESILLDEKYLKNIIHFHLLIDFNDEQLERIWKEFEKYETLLTREVVEKIAEIVPYSTSYDQNMLKITMQDGNMVYTSIPDLMMMSHYKDMLSQLKGQSVCLVLDAQNSSINKLDCTYLNMSLEEREAKRKEEEARKKEEAQAQKRAEEEAKKQQEQEESGQQEDPESSSQEQEEPISEEDPENEGEEQVNTEEDWILMPDSGYLYSQSLNLYQDPATGLYYIWDESQGFIPTE